MEPRGAAPVATAVVVRPAHPDDLPLIVAMIRELAEYERAPDEAQATQELLSTALFGDDPAVFCHVAQQGTQVVGFALWFLNFSTWLGRHGVYLEDLYVRPAARGLRVGTALLRELARMCVDRGYARLDWQVLDWNDPARRFYASLGATGMTQWVPYRLSGDALHAFAGHPTQADQVPPPAG